MEGKTQLWLGFDYGTSNCAVGIVAPDGGSNQRYAKLDPKWSTLKILRAIEELLDSPPLGLPAEGISASVEHSFYRESMNTFGRMVRVRTCIEIALDLRGIAHETMGVSAWKKAICGTPKLKKEEAHEIAAQIWPLEEYTKAQRYHMWDALCIAETARRREVGESDNTRGLPEHHGYPAR